MARDNGDPSLPGFGTSLTLYCLTESAVSVISKLPSNMSLRKTDFDRFEKFWAHATVTLQNTPLSTTGESSNRIITLKVVSKYDGMSAMYENSEFADLTIKTADGAEFCAHCVVVGASSPVLKTMLTCGMMESLGKRIEFPRRRLTRTCDWHIFAIRRFRGRSWRNLLISRANTTSKSPKTPCATSSFRLSMRTAL